MFVFCVFIIALTVIGLRQAATHISNKEIEQRLTRWMGLPVTINKANISWSGYMPVIVFSKVSIGSTNTSNAPIYVSNLLMSVDIFNTIKYQTLQPKRLLLDKALIKLSLAQDGVLHLSNLLKLNTNVGGNLHTITHFFSWFIRQKEATIRKIDINVAYNNKNFVVKLPRIHFVGGENFSSVNAELSSFDKISTKLSLIGNFNGSEIHHLDGQWYLSLNKFPLSFMDHHFELGPLKLTDGLVDIKLWGSVSKGLLSTIKANIDTKDLIYTHARNEIAQEINRFSIKLEGEKKAGLTIFNVHLNLGSKESKKSYSVRVKAKSQDTYSVYLPKIYINDLKNLLITLGVAKKYYAWMKGGALQAIHINLRKGKLNDVSLGLSDISIGDGDVIIKPINGWLEVLKSKAELVLSTHNGQLIVNNQTLSPSLQQFFTHIIYDFNENTLQVKKALVKLGDNQLSSALIFRQANDFYHSHLDSMTKVLLNRPGEILGILNSVIPDSKLNRWLVGHLKQTKGIGVAIQTQGAISNIKTIDKSFLSAKVSVHDVDFKYHKAWPKLQHINGQLEINNSILNASLSQVCLEEACLHDVPFSLYSIFSKTPHLLVRYETLVDKKRIQNYIMSSPLRSKLNILDSINVAKPLRASLSINTHVNSHDKVLVQGNIYFDKHDIDVFTPFKIRLHAVDGEIAYTDQGIRYSNLKAHIFSNPAEIRLLPQAKNDSSLELAIKSNINMSKIDSSLLGVLTEKVGGEFTYTVDLIAHSLNNFSVKISSDLSRLILNLPKPLNTITHSDKPLKINIVRDNANYNVKVTQKPNIKGTIKLKKNRLSNILSGKISIGSHSTDTYQDKLSLNIGELSLDKWIDIFNKHTDARNPLVGLHQKLHLTIDKLYIGRSFVSKVRAILTIKDKRLHIQFYGHDIYGGVDVTFNGKKIDIKARLSHLHVFTRETNSKLGDQVKYELPSVDLKIDDLSINQNFLGKVFLSTEVTSKGYKIKQFSLLSNIYKLALVGFESSTHQKQITRLQGSASTKDFTKLLTLLDVHPVVSAKKASMQFEVNYPGALTSFNLNQINGDFKLDMSYGRVIRLSKEVEAKIGLGKLISILSLQTLPRRLTLDFNDLAYKGFSFDIVSGHFHAKQGVLTTPKTYIDGPVAYVEMKGDIDLNKKTYEMQLLVAPHVTASIPVVATLAGGPLAGAIAWVANRILSSSMKKITGLTYRLDGPWSEPNLTKVHFAHHHNHV